MVICRSFVCCGDLSFVSCGDLPFVCLLWWSAVLTLTLPLLISKCETSSHGGQWLAVCLTVGRLTCVCAVVYQWGAEPSDTAGRRRYSRVVASFLRSDVQRPPPPRVRTNSSQRIRIRVRRIDYGVAWHFPPAACCCCCCSIAGCGC